jgi:class 3 adenylate cyclase
MQPRIGPVPSSDRWERLPGPIQWLADLGGSEADDDEMRLRRRVLNLAAALMVALAPIWVVTYLALGLELSAAIPLLWMVAAAAFIGWHARTGAYRAFRFVGLLMMLTFPFLLGWTLGGFANSSLVALWGLTAPLGALFFGGPRYALPWFAGFAVLTLVSVGIDPALSDGAPDVPRGVRVAFFGLDLLFVSLTIFLLLQYFVRARDRERTRSERLLLNVLPPAIATRLKRSPAVIADRLPAATVLFADLVGFTPLSARVPPEELVRLLDEVFTSWDELAERHGLEKIKTIGDAYLVAGGIPTPRPDHAEAVARMALEMIPALAACGRGYELSARIGIDTGPVVAGVIGRAKFSYDLWGDTVNTASRMESSGEPGRIQVTERVRAELEPAFRFAARPEIAVKGKGPMRTYFLEAAAQGVSAPTTAAAGSTSSIRATDSPA